MNELNDLLGGLSQDNPTTSELTEIVGDVQSQANKEFSSMKKAVVGIVTVAILIIVGFYVLKRLRNVTAGK